MRKQQLDGDLRRIRSGGDLELFVYDCHDLDRSNTVNKIDETKKKKKVLGVVNAYLEPSSSSVAITSSLEELDVDEVGDFARKEKSGGLEVESETP